MHKQLRPELTIYHTWVGTPQEADVTTFGTYSQSGTAVTVTAPSNGLSVGQNVYLNFTSGALAAGWYSVATVTNSSTFTVTSGVSQTTSGNVASIEGGLGGTANASVIVVDIWHWTPFCFLLLLAGLESLPQDIYESVKMDGANAWQELRRITLPLIHALAKAPRAEGREILEMIRSGGKRMPPGNRAIRSCSGVAVKIAERYCAPSSGPCRFSWVGSCAIAKNTCRSLPYVMTAGS